MRLTAFGGGVLVVVLGVMSVPASAQETASNVVETVAGPRATTNESLFQTGGGSARTAGTGEHKLGVGIRTGGFGFGIGASLRSWFQPPWGFQVGVSHYGYGDFFGVSYGSTQFTPAVLYEFAPIAVNAPLSLRPIVGGGVSIIRSSFSYLNNADTTNTGVLILGGVELFFKQVPKLGVTGEFEFTPSNDPFSGVSSVGGPGFVALAHWYFK